MFMIMDMGLMIVAASMMVMVFFLWRGSGGVMDQEFILVTVAPTNRLVRVRHFFQMY
jgi:hypothetical protein